MSSCWEFASKAAFGHKNEGHAAETNRYTFNASAVTPDKVDWPLCKGSLKKLYKDAYPEFKNLCDKIIQGSANHDSNKRSWIPQDNGFVHTVMDCYCYHHNLELRPDDVWLAIVTQFSFFVNANSETLRSTFVKHEGRIEVQVPGIGNLYTADYGKLSITMAEELKHHLASGSDPEIVDWILPNFSTTSSHDRIVGSVLLMSTFKKYFKSVFELSCGIPKVTLLGNVNDWEDVLARVKKLHLYGDQCTKWAAMLEAILAEIVQSAKGNPNGDFWACIASAQHFGSGSQHISGWITAFMVFSKRGDWQGDAEYHPGVYRLGDVVFPKISTACIPPGYGTVDVLVKDNGAQHDTVMFAGHMGQSRVDPFTLAPQLRWSICLKKTGPKTEEEPNPMGNAESAKWWSKEPAGRLELAAAAHWLQLLTDIQTIGSYHRRVES